MSEQKESYEKELQRFTAEHEAEREVNISSTHIPPFPSTHSIIPPFHSVVTIHSVLPPCSCVCVCVCGCRVCRVSCVM